MNWNVIKYFLKKKQNYLGGLVDANAAHAVMDNGGDEGNVEGLGGDLNLKTRKLDKILQTLAPTRQNTPSNCVFDKILSLFVI